MQTVLRRYTHQGQCITNTDLSKYLTRVGFYIIDTVNQFVYANKSQYFISDMTTIKYFGKQNSDTIILNRYPSGLSKNKFSKSELSKYMTAKNGNSLFYAKNLNADIKTPKFYHHPTLTFYKTLLDSIECFDIEICGDTPESNEKLNNILPANIPKINLEPRHNYICLEITKQNNGVINPNDIIIYSSTRLYKGSQNFGVSNYICQSSQGEISIIKPVGTVQKPELYINDMGIKCYDKHIAYILIFETLKIKLSMLIKDFEKMGVLDD